VIAHEYIHVQQSEFLIKDEHPTVLEVSLIEGAAEFMGEMISGGVANPGVWTEAKGREREIEAAFVSDEDKTDPRPDDRLHWLDGVPAAMTPHLPAYCRHRPL
jgi:uncharacterized protein YjaZ